MGSECRLYLNQVTAISGNTVKIQVKALDYSSLDSLANPMLEIGLKEFSMAQVSTSMQMAQNILGLLNWIKNMEMV